MKPLKNESGLTLVELLAALALIGIIATLAGTALTQAFHSNGIVESEASLKQQANTLMTSLREHSNNNETNICFHEPSTLTTDKGVLWSHDNITISELYIENLQNSAIIDNKRFEDLPYSEPIANGECQDMNVNQPTYVKIKLTTQSSHEGSYQASTILSKHREMKLTINYEGENDIEKDPLPSEPTNNDCKKYINTGPVDGGIECHEPLTLNNGDELIVRGAARFNENVELKNSSILKIKGRATFDGDITIKKKASIYVDGAVTFNTQNTINGNGEVCAGGPFDDQPNSRSEIRDNQGVGNCIPR